MTTLKLTLEISDTCEEKVGVSDTKADNCRHPKTQIWQWRDHWFCCRCWHRERGQYAGSVFDK